MVAYKLFRQRKDRTLGPLYIARHLIVPVGIWLDAEDYPTEGYAHRPGWHATHAPRAPHIKPKPERVWYCVEIADFKIFQRPEYQGGRWYIANKMKVLAPCCPLTLFAV